MLSSDDVVLAIAEGWGTIPGRTVLQKVGFFVGVQLGVDLGYKAHYYGPYSTAIAATAEERVMVGELIEQRRQSAIHSSGPHDPRAYYCYRMSPTGKRAAQIRRGWNPAEYEKAVAVARQVKDVVDDLHANAMQLSVAAKVDFILDAKRGAGSLTYYEIRKAAGQLKWNLSHDDIDKGVEILVKLGRAVKGDTT